MNTFEIQTSAWKEENFTIVTDLNENLVTKLIAEMVKSERQSDKIQTTLNSSDTNIQIVL
jgi:hypothetical protein